VHPPISRGLEESQFLARSRAQFYSAYQIMNAAIWTFARPRLFTLS
jgi:hypothetical protein